MSNRPECYVCGTAQCARVPRATFLLCSRCSDDYPVASVTSPSQNVQATYVDPKPTPPADSGCTGVWQPLSKYLLCDGACRVHDCDSSGCRC